MKQKIITILLLTTVITGPMVPRVSFGQGLPTYDIGLNSYGQGGVMGTIKEYGLDSLAYSLSKLAGTKISNKVFNKATGGASGDSSQISYIQNFSKHFSDLGLGQVDKFITDLGVSNNPFAKNIAQSLITNIQSGGSDLEGFNLDRIIPGGNIAGFTNDASVGGWDALLALSNPANTNIGSALIAKSELSNRIETAKEIEKIKLGSSGTKPQGKCNLTFGDYKANVQQTNTALGGNTNNPRATPSNSSSINQDNANQAAQNNANSQANQNSVNQNSQNNANQAAQNADNSGSTGVDAGGIIEDYGGCLNELIQNPLGLVTSTISKQLDTIAESASQGDEIGEILVGMLINMATSFLQGGLTALNAEFQQSRDNVGGPEQLVASNGQSIPWTATPNIIVDLPAEFQPAIDSTEKEVRLLNNYITTVTENRAGQESFSDVMIRLDICTPGPDFQYEKRIDIYANKELRTLNKKQEKGTDKDKEDRADAKAIIEPSLKIAKTDLELWINNPQRNIPGAGIMHDQVAQVKTIKSKYQKTKGDLLEKQSALNMLYKIENDLKTNLQLLKPYITGMPTSIPFTNQGWSKLTTAEKTQLFNWAKAVSKRTTTAADDLSKRDFTLSVVWDVWTNPDVYITNTSWNNTDFLQKKNIIRTNYVGIQNDISIPYSMQQAEQSVRQLQTAIDATKKLANDCETMRDLISRNRFTGNDAHDKLLQVLKTNKNKFVTNAIRESLDSNSILSTPPGVYPEGVACRTEFGRPGPWQWAGNHTDRMCRQDAGIENQDAQNGGQLSYASDNEYQTQPARDIWEVLDQDNARQLFCTFNQYLADFTSHATNVNKGEILCDPSRQRAGVAGFTGIMNGLTYVEGASTWYNIKKIDFVGYLYSNDLGN